MDTSQYHKKSSSIMKLLQHRSRLRHIFQQPNLSRYNTVQSSQRSICKRFKTVHNISAETRPYHLETKGETKDRCNHCKKGRRKVSTHGFGPDRVESLNPQTYPYTHAGLLSSSEPEGVECFKFSLFRNLTPRTLIKSSPSHTHTHFRRHHERRESTAHTFYINSLSILPVLSRCPSPLWSQCFTL